MKAEKSKKNWLWRDQIVKADTKSEARSELKRWLGLKRLPPGAIVARRLMRGWRTND